MDDPEDFLMGEDSIVGSTELNGDIQTVDPSVFAMDTSTDGQSPRKDQLPILTYQHPAAASSPSLEIDQAADLRDDALYDTNSSSSPAVETSDDSSECTAPTQPEVVISRPPGARSAALPHSTLRSGLIYDMNMKFHMDQEKNEKHPEDPRRISAIWQTLVNAGLVELSNSTASEDCDVLWNIDFRPATRGEIVLVHSEKHYKWVKNLQKESGDDLANWSQRLDSIYVNEFTYLAACLAAGGAIAACKAVVTREVKNVMAVIRPPGHHAEQDEASGFCIFNNVSVAARVSQHNYPEICRKILILDWDVHHGNGIQHAFYQDPNVLYISIHVYKNGMFYPGAVDGNHEHCGEGPGEGKNINIPWSETGMGDYDYLYAFEEIVIPVAREFNPDLVIVAAGFDAADGDELGGCHVSPAGYAHMTHKLMELADGKIVVCLEGGYNLEAISKSALAVVKTLMGEPPGRLPDPDSDDNPTPSASGNAIIKMVQRHQAQYWDCMRQKIQKPKLTSQSIQMHDLVREWRNLLFSREYNMQTLHIDKSYLAKSFEDNVLVSDTIFEDNRRPLLVIFHDPPNYDVLNDPESVQVKTDLHNSWLTDGTKTYVDWAVKHDFAVIDVNVPKHMVDWPDEGDRSDRALSVLREERGDFIPSKSVDKRTKATREVAKYLWENYIEAEEFTDVFLMGVGDPSAGLVEFLGAQDSVNAEDSPLRQVFMFLESENILHQIKRAADDYIGAWYYQHSRVFAANDHHVWKIEKTRERKIRKRYGQVIKADSDALGEMLEDAKGQVTNIFLEQTQDWRRDQVELARNMASALRSEERDLRASSAPNPLRSPTGMPPIGMFSATPRSPAKRM